MNAACGNVEPSSEEYFKLSRIQKFSLIFLFAPFAFLFFFSPIPGVFGIAFGGLAMLAYSRTRIHGILFIAGIVYAFVGALLAQHGFYWLVVYGEVLNGILLFSLPFIPLFISDLIPVLAFMWAIFLTPLLLFEILYWLWHSGSRWIQVLGIVLIAAISAPAVLYCQHCRHNYQAIQSYQGKTMPAEELYALVGKPVYEAFHSGPMDLRPHYVYTDGDLIVPVTVDENGMATVHNRVCCFLGM